jgi:branched-chain amino acid transport system ATP-binding protein
MIEHVMQAVMALSDVIIVLHHGEKIFEGTPRAAASDPRVVEAYLGEELVLA